MGNEDAFVIKKSAVIYSVVILAVFALGIFAESQLSITGAFFGTRGDTTTTSTITTVPQRVAVSVGTNPVLGSSSAPVTIIEFSDFQCPYCRVAYLQSLPSVKTNYIDTGKVKFYYRNFPLSFHPASMKAAEAAECANEQGKFWEMHNKISDEQAKLGQGTIQFNVTDMKKWASEIGLDASKFDSCIDSDKYQSSIDKDVSEGTAAGVTGTPTFFIGTEKDGYYALGGAYPYSSFQEIIDAELKRLGKA
ncbi:MAG: thioredoxin domain-containing protein [Candidatus Aenigmatarchaeota archaeon]